MGCRESKSLPERIHQHSKAILILDVGILLQPDLTLYPQTERILSWCQQQLCVAIVTATGAETMAIQRTPAFPLCCLLTQNISLADGLWEIARFFRTEGQNLIYFTRHPLLAKTAKAEGIWTVLLLREEELTSSRINSSLHAYMDFVSR